jgi:hypothetical protein
VTSGLQRLELLVLRSDPVGSPAQATIPSAPILPAPGPADPDVLQLLLNAGLVEQDPRGPYQMNDLLQAMTGAAAHDRHAPGAQRTGTSRSTGE